ncbi:MAG: leucine--tRNA ligase [archaeon]|nr:leucine--tRNA ligase [archaeon]
MTMQEYSPIDIEKKWQKKWEEDQIFTAKKDKNKKKYYVLEMYPYPSGHMHMGHLKNYSIGDSFARYKRMQDYNVLYPMGYDSFGMPAENAAIKHNADPMEWTQKNIENFISQQKTLGLSYDWSKILWSHDPDYYKWNQWVFIKLFEKGLVSQEEAYVNWCPECTTVLANEQVINGKCWRCSSKVDQKFLRQWFFNIREYADELLYSIDELNWPEKVKIMQRNWIGRSEGTEIEFVIVDSGEKINIFTTRVDTLYGVTFMVFAPEHPYVAKWVKGTEYEKPFNEFLDEVLHEDKFLRTSEESEKKGLFIGKHAINPINGEKVPVYVGNFVIYEYGGGAVMAVPSHDQRDFEFAKKFNIPIRVVIQPLDGYKLDGEKMSRAFLDDGLMDNSEEFNGGRNRASIPAIEEKLKKMKKGSHTINYKLRNWLISRQRYWGTPIPMINCTKCGPQPVSLEELPVLLPKDVKFTGTGNPLETSDSYVKCKCPKCKNEARRETDTMDTFVDSSWYFLKFASRDDGDLPLKKEDLDYWAPIDTYIGGIEHAILHLLYARFYTKATRDLGLHTINEPFSTLITQGMINKAHPFCIKCNKFLPAAYDEKNNWVGEYDPKKQTCNTCGEKYTIQSAKMSKSLGNTLDPTDITKEYGADTARLFILHSANPEKEIEWSDEGVFTENRLIKRLWNLLNEKDIEFRKEKHVIDEFVNFKIHSTIQNVTEIMDKLYFRDAINEIMGLIDVIRNYISEPVDEKTFKKAVEILSKMMAPFIPHVIEEIWQLNGNKSMMAQESWPKFDEKFVDADVKAQWKAYDNLIDDIKNIIKVIKNKGTTDLNEITMIIADDWRSNFISSALDLLNKGTKRGLVIKEIMKNPEFKQHGKEINKILGKILVNIGKFSVPFKSQLDEVNFWKETKSLIEKRFELRITIEFEPNSTNPKKNQALPGKPAIILK